MINLIKSRAAVIKAIRDYFAKTGSTEVETPILNIYPNLDPHIYPVELKVENSEGKQITAYLHTSPEYNMKKILAAYKKDIHQITHVFRNYEGSFKHTIEFLMLEWYRVDYNLDMLMEDTKRIFMETAKALYNRYEIEYKGKKYNLENWEKITVDEAFYKYTGIYPDQKEKLYQFLKNSPMKHGNLKEEDYETNFFLAYSFYVEPHLGKEKPTFIYDYPPEFSALAKIINGKGKRFEAYIGGLELVNGYYELTDPVELGERLKKEAKNHKIDTAFIKTAEKMPECSGASLGIDRLLMVLLNKKNIKQVQVLNWI
ncbi:elongation factor P--(R)-beta-lysine ligase [Persephonella sp. KM09-Lau-8]|uniref:elongation factor P--(R)-beta-lysine ligase n=1 Tax=Persephonella sp. KM09-Lau-8 TaxID=1158345 RepID=UPI000691BA8A|nr:elongation factor P--(R)-beta-lysine ligase [Persephonella sp. KM09-Lau-8]